jgi:hypothetical protein
VNYKVFHRIARIASRPAARSASYLGPEATFLVTSS